jgi:hypothetical protein
VHKRTGEVRSFEDFEDATSRDYGLGTGSLAYDKENRREIGNLLNFLEGRSSRLE